QRPEHPQENLLRQVLRLGAAVGKPEAEPVHAARVHAHQFLPRGLIAAQTSRNQAEIGIQSSSGNYALAILNRQCRLNETALTSSENRYCRRRCCHSSRSSFI